MVINDLKQGVEQSFNVKLLEGFQNSPLLNDVLNSTSTEKTIELSGCITEFPQAIWHDHLTRENSSESLQKQQQQKNCSGKRSKVVTDHWLHSMNPC